MCVKSTSRTRVREKETDLVKRKSIGKLNRERNPEMSLRWFDG